MYRNHINNIVLYRNNIVMLLIYKYKERKIKFLFFPGFNLHK